MKRVVIYLAAAVVIITLGFLAGRWFENFIKGPRTIVSENESYSTDLGPVSRKVSFESVGWKPIIPATTIIEFSNRIIYKAEADFHEGIPHASVLKVHGDSIKWDDGEYHFELSIKKQQKSEQSGPDSPRPSGTSVMSPADPASRAGAMPEASGGI